VALGQHHIDDVHRHVSNVQRLVLIATGATSFMRDNSGTILTPRTPTNRPRCTRASPTVARIMVR
jgi:hypothetical protein